VALHGVRPKSEPNLKTSSESGLKTNQQHAKETKFFQHKGHVVSKRVVAALGTRTQALDLAFRLIEQKRQTLFRLRGRGGSLTMCVIPLASPSGWLSA
jgi:hypothetical protein